jgi:hypothetical protein
LGRELSVGRSAEESLADATDCRKNGSNDANTLEHQINFVWTYAVFGPQGLA